MYAFFVFHEWVFTFWQFTEQIKFELLILPIADSYENQQAYLCQQIHKNIIIALIFL